MNPVIQSGVDMLSRFLDEHPKPTGLEVEGAVRTLLHLYHIENRGVNPIVPSNLGFTISYKIDGLSLDLYRAGPPALLEVSGRELAEKMGRTMKDHQKYQEFLDEATTNGVLVMFAVRPLKPEEIR